MKTPRYPVGSCVRLQYARDPVHLVSFTEQVGKAWRFVTACDVVVTSDDEGARPARTEDAVTCDGCKDAG